MMNGVEYKIVLDGGVNLPLVLQSGCNKPKSGEPQYPVLTITDAPPISFTAPYSQALTDYKIYGASGGVGDLVASGEHQGEYAVPVTVTDGTQSATKTVYLSSPLNGVQVYGAFFDSAAESSTAAVTYLEDAVGKTPAGIGENGFSYGDWQNAFFMPRPCMLKYDGTVDYYLDPNNYEIKAEESTFSHSDYKAVEYIESTGTQYIDTDIAVTDYENMYVDAVTKFSGFVGGTEQTFGADYVYENKTVNYNTYSAANDRLLSDFIEVSGDKIIVTIEGRIWQGTVNFEIDFYNSSKTWIAYQGWLSAASGTHSVIVNRSSNAAYIRILLKNGASYMNPNIISKTVVKCGSLGTNRRLFGVDDGGDLIFRASVQTDYTLASSHGAANVTKVGGQSLLTDDRLYYRCKHHASYVNRSDSDTNTGTIDASTLPTSTLRIFGCKSTGTSDVLDYVKMKIYRLTIGDNSGVLYELIPVERNSDGALGLYDKIGGSFYPASGTGTMNKGAYYEISDCDNIRYGGNAMVEFPKIWYKFAAGENEGEGYFYVSNAKVDNSYHCWCNYDSEDNETDHFYTNVYDVTYFNSTARSISHQYLKNNDKPSMSTQITRSTANNAGTDVEWYTSVFSDKQLIDALLMLIGKSVDLSSTFGNGCHSDSSANPYTTYQTGVQLDNKGLFYGSISDTLTPVKVFGMENWYSFMRPLSGLRFAANSFVLAKLTYGTADGSTVTGYKEDSSSTAYNDQYLTLCHTYVTSGDWNYITQYTFSEYGYFPLRYDSSATGSIFNQTVYSNDASSYGALIYNYGAPIARKGLNSICTAQTSANMYPSGLSCKPVAGGSVTTQVTTLDADYIDYGAGKRYDTDGTETAVTLPELSVYSGENTLSVGTSVQPSKVSITARGIKEVE